jgi:hypothetical protein
MTSFENINTTTPEELQMQCPVCRKVILAEDVIHVRDYLTEEKPTKLVRNSRKMGFYFPFMLSNSLADNRKSSNLFAH